MAAFKLTYYMDWKDPGVEFQTFDMVVARLHMYKAWLNENARAKFRLSSPLFHDMGGYYIQNGSNSNAWFWVTLPEPKGMTHVYAQLDMMIGSDMAAFMLKFADKTTQFYEKRAPE
jgi:hypothetical protein